MNTKVCVVTGSSSGIGAATVRLYAAAGWNEVVNVSSIASMLGPGRYAATVEAYKGKAVLNAVIRAKDVAQTAWYLGAHAAKTTGEVLLVDASLRLFKA